MKKVVLFVVLSLALGCKKIVIPLPPSSLEATVISPTQVDLRWTDRSANESGFKVQRKTGTAAFQDIATTVQNATTYSDQSVSPNTTYTYRVYAFNGAGGSASYTNEVTVTTWGVPTVSTAVISEINNTGAKSGGTVSSTGGYPVTARGIVWSETANPTTALTTKTTDGTGTGAFESILSGLTQNKTYHVRAYATNSFGTGYGNDITFTTTNVDINTGLIAYYPFNGNANDESGNGNNLITTGNPNFINSTHTMGCNFATGFDYFTTPSQSWSLINNLPQGTVSFWIKLNSQYISGHYFGLGNTFMVKQKHGVGEDLFFGLQDGTTKVRMQVSGVFPSGAESNVIGNTSLSINQWYHIVGVWNGVTHTLYINGNMDGQITNSGGISNRPLPDFFSIGSATYGHTDINNPTGAYGVMDEIRIYNRALTQDQFTYLATH